MSRVASYVNDVLGHTMNWSEHMKILIYFFERVKQAKRIEFVTIISVQDYRFRIFNFLRLSIQILYGLFTKVLN